jgi:hypothetical protein
MKTGRKYPTGNNSADTILLLLKKKKKKKKKNATINKTIFK